VQSALVLQQENAVIAKTVRCILAAALFAASTPLLAQQAEQPVKVYVDHLPANVAEQVRKHAAQGETSLKRYLERTNSLHRLRWEDVTTPRPQPVSDTGGLEREPKKHANQYR
jgi:hypothetical protein